ncbi:hypothetical protein ASG17_00815 [Brevundimonas sp. Leaf363]|uniref:hypothetical protein n=1 Tax=Brevundimonas sp. Leaf363 TaxID=1736353 RepID=UPI0006FEF98B|nr:hypothetical protein [Brevundimonas sp. Leaf363]KQS57309.1 hypothetical protein ASG17_00815 [Brevundimonas sp. Leaf363]
MNNSTFRIALAAVVTFYVIVGGLWATNYFPLRNFEASIARSSEVVGDASTAFYESEEYQAENRRQVEYSLSHPSVLITERRITLYESLLLWGTLGIVVAAGVMFLTRRRKTPRTATASGD